MRRSKLVLTAVIVFVLGFGVAAYAKNFSHMLHKQQIEQEECSACHKRDALSIVPEKQVCSNCHTQDELGKVELGKVETHGATWYKDHKHFARLRNTENPQAQCNQCHKDDFCLDCHKGGFREEAEKANVHRSDYLVTHPILAKRGPTTCASCHEDRFCNACHERFQRSTLRFESHTSSWSNLGTPPHSTYSPTQCSLCHTADTLPSHDWSGRHAREARRNLQLCQSCHEDAQVCIKCHGASTGLRVNPHPKGWSKIKGNYEKASDGATCKRCH